jgi:hypothetical protein
MKTDSMATGIDKYLIGIPFKSSIFSRVEKFKKWTYFSIINQKREDYT